MKYLMIVLLFMLCGCELMVKNEDGIKIGTQYQSVCIGGHVYYYYAYQMANALNDDGTPKKCSMGRGLR